MPGCGFSILPNRQLGKGVNVSELGERDRTFAAETVDILTESVRYVGADVAATILAPGVHRRGEVSGCAWPMWMSKLYDDPNIEGSAPTSGPIWRWGNQKDGCESGFGECRLNDGPTGPIDKGVWDSATLQ